MTGTYDEADYLSTAPRRVRTRPTWLRLGLPVVAIFLVAGGIAAFIGLTTQELFEAEAEVELITPANLADVGEIPLPGERIAAARSSAVSTRAVTELGLLEDPRFLTVHPALDTGDIDIAERRVRAASLLLQNTRTEIDDGGSIAAIAYRSPDPALAADIANALATAFVPADAERLAGIDGNSRAELEALVAQVRTELEEAERNLAEGMSEADIVALPADEAGLVTVDGDDALTAEARDALQSQLAFVRSRLDSMEAAIASGAVDSSDPVIAQLRESREGLEQEYDRITQQFREDYPAALDLRERIDVIDATLSREAVRITEERADEARRLRIQESDLRAQIEALGYEVAERGTAGLGLTDLQKDVLEKRELYSLLLGRLATSESRDMPTTSRVIAAAVPPTRPVVPDWRLIIAVSAAVALLLSGLLVARDVRRQRLI
ncbi:hypothetical protein GCM10023208_10340 [Erythrobacter westpacificensis]|uniref:Polysaccharide chain length determinant N-terminal domain-containing protein n=1 Tax=Erythrobacter westpacificensis TaxID=1055231 RepID=A0ABP9K432_9SPHN